jgi:hypothetical protein
LAQVPALQLLPRQAPKWALHQAAERWMMLSSFAVPWKELSAAMLAPGMKAREAQPPW